MTDSIAAAANGWNSPRASSTPLAVSVTAAAVANSRPGRNPIDSQEAGRAGNTVTAEPAEQFLRSVGGHQDADDNACE